MTQEAVALSHSQLCLDFKHPRINKCGHAHLDFSKMEPPGYSELHPRQANDRGPAPQGRGLEGQPQAAGPSLPGRPGHEEMQSAGPRPQLRPHLLDAVADVPAVIIPYPPVSQRQPPRGRPG